MMAKNSKHTLENLVTISGKTVDGERVYEFCYQYEETTEYNVALPVWTSVNAQGKINTSRTQKALSKASKTKTVNDWVTVDKFKAFAAYEACKAAGMIAYEQGGEDWKIVEMKGQKGLENYQ